MEEGTINDGMLYHEVQESKLCGLHCVNNVLQGPFFSEIDLSELSSDVDRSERQVTAPGVGGPISNQFLSEDSDHVSLRGDFSIQVLQKAMEVWDLQVIPLDSLVAEHTEHDPTPENAYICHFEDHWFCIRKVNGEWYNFNSLYAAPEHLSIFSLSAFLDTLRSSSSGWRVFVVRGSFPKECPIWSSEASNKFGQWLTPEEAERITISCNQSHEVATQQDDPLLPHSYQQESAESFKELYRNMVPEEEDWMMMSAIEASLMNLISLSVEAGVAPENSNRTDSIKVGSGTGSGSSVPSDRTEFAGVAFKEFYRNMMPGEEDGMRAAIEACLVAAIKASSTDSPASDDSKTGTTQDVDAGTSVVPSQHGSGISMSTSEDVSETSRLQDSNKSMDSGSNVFDTKED